jgi:DNA-binding transcriptional regulator LsrR (DeoR family)
MPKKTMRDVEIADRRRKVAAFYLNKYDQQEIANMLGVHQSTISRDIAYLSNKWLESTKDDIEKMKCREIAELERMEKDAAAMYINAKNGEKPKDAVAWMEQRLKIKDRRARLLGLDQAQKIDLDTQQNIVVNLTMEDW